VDLSIDRADHDDETVMSVGGEIDVYTAPIVRERLDAAVRDGHVNLVVDLSRVRFLDSTGLGVLVGRLKLTRSRGGSLRLVATEEKVLKVFAITGLDKVFELYETLDEALAASAADREARRTAPAAKGSEEGAVNLDTDGPGKTGPGKGKREVDPGSDDAPVTPGQPAGRGA
jgi:anti-sigma B factor antagonist